MIFNIISLSLQLVSSGVIVPHEMLSKTYQTIGELFPQHMQQMAIIQ